MCSISTRCETDAATCSAMNCAGVRLTRLECEVKTGAMSTLVQRMQRKWLPAAIDRTSVAQSCSGTAASDLV
jgi:hypothetical protein